MQGGATSTQYKGLADCLGSIVRAEGLGGLYRGIAPTLLGIAPYVGINFLVYETLKEHAPTTTPSALWLAGCGAVAGEMPAGCAATHKPRLQTCANGAYTPFSAGTTGQTVAYPADVLRRRFQLQALEDATTKYSGVFGAVRQIIRQEGVLGLYKGCK